MLIEPYYMQSLVFDAPTHTYRVSGLLVPHITEIVPSNYDHVPPDRLEIARLRGTAVHKATELYDLRRLNWLTFDQRLNGYLEAWIKFKNTYEVEFEDCDVERRLYHPVYRYAGTGDRPRSWVCPPGINRRRVLTTIEIKSIAKMDENVDIQTAGQFCAENYRARKVGLPEIEERLGVQLKPDGNFKAIFYDEHKLKERVFLSYLTTLNWEVQHGKRRYAIQGKYSPSRSNGQRRYQRAA